MMGMFPSCPRLTHYPYLINGVKVMASDPTSPKQFSMLENLIHKMASTWCEGWRSSSIIILLVLSPWLKDGLHLLVEISIFCLIVGSSRGYTPLKTVDNHTRNGWDMDEWYPITSHMKTSNIIVRDRIWRLTLRHDVEL